MYISVFIHLTVNGYLGSFQFGAMLIGVIIYKEMKKKYIYTCMLVYTHTSVEYISRSESVRAQIIL